MFGVFEAISVCINKTARIDRKQLSLMRNGSVAMDMADHYRLPVTPHKLDMSVLPRAPFSMDVEHIVNDMLMLPDPSIGCIKEL